MNQQVKKEMLKGMAPAAVPVCRTLINNHFENKRIKKRQQFEVAKAKHTSQSLQSMSDGEAAQAEPVDFDAEVDHDPSDDPLADAMELAEDLDRRLSEASEQEDCGFCRDVLEGLRDEPPEVQQRGLSELRELRRVMYSDPTPEEVDRAMDSMEVIPRIIVDG